MELTKNQKIVGISLAGVVAWLLYKKKVKFQSHRADTPSGPVQVLVPVPTDVGTGAIANVLGNILPTAHTELVSKALSQVPLVVQNGKVAPTRISTIADVQHALNFLKVCPTPLKDTGVLDAATVNCLKAYQSIMQIPITGMADPTTKMTLESSVTKAGISVSAPTILSNPSVTAPPTNNPIIATERDLQRGLNLLGASPKLKEDGKIGPLTTAAIKAFQVVHGLVADGLASPQTKAVIASAMQGDPNAAANTATQVANTAAQVAMNGNFGYIPPPVTHPGIPGFMGAGDGPGRYIPLPREYGRPGLPGRPWDHLPGAPLSSPGFGPPAPPLPDGDLRHMQSWERWQQVHPGTAYADYQGWYAQNAASGATINGEGPDVGFARSGIRGGGIRRPMFRDRAHAFALGLPYVEEDVPVDDSDGDGQVDISGEAAFGQARHSFEEAFARGDRRFEHPGIAPGVPPLPGENHYHQQGFGHRGFGPFGFTRGALEHRGFGEPGGIIDRFRGWFGLGRRERRIDDNPYIPPAATPEVMNFDPFANTTAPAVERWHPDDLRRREELERRGFAPTAPIEPGRPAPPIIDHPSPPGPPPPRV